MVFSGDYLEDTGQLAPISRYAEEKLYISTAHQAGKNVTDSDLNEFGLSLVNQLRRTTSLVLGDGSPNDGFKIAEASSPADNFKIEGGDGTTDGAGRLFVDGWPLLLPSDADYISNTPLLCARVTAIVTTSLTDDTLEDAHANWPINSLVGRALVPDISVPGTTFTILSNTATQIVVSASMTGSIAVGNYYRVNLSTPGGSRTDKVYVNLFLDEVGMADDSDLGHDIGIPPTPRECARRLILRPVIIVTEGGTFGGDYVDGEGQQHWVSLLATISRTASANITSAMLVDERVPFGSLDSALEYSISPLFEIVSTSGITTTVAPPDPTTTYETTFSAASTGAGLQINFQFAGQMASSHTILEWLKLPIWGTGSYRLYVYSEGTGSVYDSGLQSTPVSRTILTVTRAMMGMISPTGEKRFVAEMQVFLNAGETFNSSVMRVRHF